MNETLKEAPKEEEQNTQCCCGPETPLKIEYRAIPFDGSINVNGREINRVSSDWQKIDHLGEIMVRLNFLRMNYAVKPGLYAIGNPDSRSDVMVSANYKLSFDILRRDLKGLNAWLLVIDTKGVNVWCAAGKGTFGTQEVVKRVLEEKLSEVVSHKELILPQLSAPGVNCIMVNMLSDFNVVYGPVRSQDIKMYMQNGKKADIEMRRVRFNFNDRLSVMWLELMMAAKMGLLISVVLFLIGMLLPGFEELAEILTFSLWIAIIAGSCLTPLLLPYIPGRAFSFKGGLLGVILTPVITIFYEMGFIEMIYTGLMVSALSAYLAVNFTGASTYTSLSGVKKELKISIPVIIGFLFIAVILFAGRNI